MLLALAHKTRFESRDSVMTKATRTVLLGVAAFITTCVIACYFVITDARTIISCQACLRSDPHTCAQSEDFEDSDTAKTASKTNLCSKLYPNRDSTKIISCLDLPDDQNIYTCSRRLKRTYRRVFHVN